MTAQEWKAKSEAAAEVVPLPLPSGMVIRARRPGPMQFAQWDKLPLLLAVVDGGKLETSEAADVAAFMRELLIYCCVEPRVSVTPTEEEIHPRLIHEADWKAIIRWAMRLEEAERLRSFRGKRTDDGGDGDGEAVFVQTVGIDGDHGSGDGSGVRPGGGDPTGGDGARG